MAALEKGEFSTAKEKLARAARGFQELRDGTKDDLPAAELIAGECLGVRVRTLNRAAAHVLRLFLRPDPLAGRAITAQGGLQRVGRPGVELFQPHQGDLAGLAGLLAAVEEIVVDLAAAKH